MLTFANAVRAIDEFLQSRAPSGVEVLDFHTPVQFDGALMSRLLAAHEALNKRFATLLCLLDHNYPNATEVARECLKQFHELRRAESIWLYPVIARAVDDDEAARSRLMELRLITLTLARRTMRCFDTLIRAVDAEDPGRRGAAEELSHALADYLRRSETEIYPLYSLISLMPGGRAVQAA